MCTMVEATLPAEQFALSDTLEEHPSAELHLLRLVADGTDRALPFIWASGDDLDALAEAVRDDPSTENVEVIAELSEEYLLRMDWVAHIRVIFYILIEEDATVLDAMAADGLWRFRILFPEHDSVSTTHEFCREYGIDLSFERIYQISESPRRGRYGLNENQYETIVHAHRAGYYEVPRDINLKELADELGVSHQALSERLRRGHGTLIENTLSPEIETAPKPRG